MFFLASSSARINWVTDSIARIARAHRQEAWHKRGLNIVKYFFRICMAPQVTRSWLGAIAKHALLNQALEQHPRVFLKPFRPYLNAAYDAAQRLAVLLRHHAFVETLPGDVIASLREGKRIPLWALEDNEGSWLVLTLARANDREGECMLELKDSADNRIAMMTFSVAGDPELQIKIGCVQGPRSSDRKDAVRRATRQLEGIRPKNLLVDAIYFLAEVWGVASIAGVSNAQQVKTRTGRIFFNYDEFWGELGGRYLPLDGEFLLPLKPLHKSLDQVPSAKRSEYRRRLGLREHLRQQLFERFKGPGLLIASPDRLHLPRAESIQSCSRPDRSQKQSPSCRP